MNTVTHLKSTQHILGILVLLFLLAACGQKPVSEVSGKALFSDADLDKARLIKSQETLVTASLEQTLSEGKTVSVPSTDFSPQAVLPGDGAKGFVVYIRHNPAAANPWAIIRFNQETDTKTSIYSGQRELESVTIDTSGNKVVFSARETTTPGSDYEVYILDLLTPMTTQLTSNDFDDTNVSMSSNGSLIAYEDLRSTTNTRSVRWYDGSTTFRLNSSVNDTMPSISGDGQFIAFVRQTTTGLFQVRRYEIATATNTSIASNTNIKKHPSISENGIKVAWVETLSTGSDRLRIKDTLANTTTNILTNANGIEHAHLRSDGNYITYGLVTAGFTRVYLRDLVGNTAIQGGSGNFNTKGMFWAYKQALPSNVRVVKANAPAGGNGLSWATAYRYLQDALHDAAQNSSIAEIWVAAGVYYPDDAEVMPGIINNDRTETFLPHVDIYGGFAGTETQQSQRNFTLNKSILSGDIEQNDLNTDGNNIAEQVSDIQGNNSYSVSSGSTGQVVFDGFTITAGQANGSSPNNAGGGMRKGFPANLSLSNITFIGNTASSGGGMFNAVGSTTLSNVTFSNNAATSSGGGILSSATITLTDVIFSGNTASTQGGGMYNNIGSLANLIDVTFSQNSAINGGGLYQRNDASTLSNVTFSQNTVTGAGGGMLNMSSSTLLNVVFTDNVANQGGGLYNNKAPTLSNVDFLFNNATQGGGMYNVTSSATPALIDTSFVENFATSGGGVYNTSSASPDFFNAIFTGNTANFGGGMYNINSSPKIIRATFSGNSAANNGGGMHSTSSSQPDLVNVVFSLNSASQGGAVANNLSSSLDITNVTFYSNTASSAGGAIRNTNGSTATIVNSIFFANTTTGGMLSNITGSSTTINYSLLDLASLPGGITGSNNILNAANPFTNSPTFDLTLSITPCNNGNNACAIDSGDKLAPGLTGVTTDLAGNPRFANIPSVPDKGTSTVPHVDMGAFEKQP